MSGFKALLNLLRYLFLASLWFVLLGGRNADPVAIYPDPDPSCEKNRIRIRPARKKTDPTSRKKQILIPILPNFDLKNLLNLFLST